MTPEMLKPSKSAKCLNITMLEQGMCRRYWACKFGPIGLLRVRRQATVEDTGPHSSDCCNHWRDLLCHDRQQPVLSHTRYDLRSNSSGCRQLHEEVSYFATLLAPYNSVKRKSMLPFFPAINTSSFSFCAPKVNFLSPLFVSACSLSSTLT